MIEMRISEAAQMLCARHVGADGRFRGCGIDTRTLDRGALFVALRGEHADGHAFLDHAAARGAAAALVEHARGELPLLLVPDTRAALARLASVWRARFALPVVAVTGSNGKTTVKEMTAAILRRSGEVLATRGNLNNELGVPLTLLGLGAEHRFAVIEMGANHPGEIAALAELARPRVGVITQCAPAHLEGFGSIEGVARAKGELFSGLPSDGTAVINAQDPYAPLWRELVGSRRRVEFALDAPADVSGSWRGEAAGGRLRLRTPTGEVELALALAGRHNARNALAAVAAALACGASLADVRRGLESVRPLPGRMQPRVACRGGALIDDTYNANPTSLEAGVDVLCELPGRHWLALGDMAELGPEAAEYHARAGEQARAAGVERLFALGPLSERAARAFGAGALHFDDAEALAAAVLEGLAPGVTVLVKGSRAMHMERVVAALVTEGDRSCC